MSLLGGEQQLPLARRARPRLARALRRRRGRPRRDDRRARHDALRPGVEDRRLRVGSARLDNARPDHGRPAVGRLRRHAHLPRHERAAARAPTGSARSRPPSRPRPNPADGTGPVTVTATVTDATSGGRPSTRRELVVDDAVATVGPGIERHPDDRHVRQRLEQTVSGTIPASATAADRAAPRPRRSTCTASLEQAHDLRPRPRRRRQLGRRRLGHPQPGQDGPADGRPARSPRTRPTARAPSRSARPVTTPPPAAPITGAEYFTGTPGADGTGTPMSLNRVATKVARDRDHPGRHGAQPSARARRTCSCTAATARASGARR